MKQKKFVKNVEIDGIKLQIIYNPLLHRLEIEHENNPVVSMYSSITRTGPVLTTAVYSPSHNEKLRIARKAKVNSEEFGA